MRLNWAAYSFDRYDGYGRYGQHMVRALTRLGVSVRPFILPQLSLPGWMQRLQGIDYSRLTITCAAPYMLRNVPGRQWALTMTEGSRIREDWVDALNERCERVIVPCEHNKESFEKSGVERPVHVVWGGTSSEEFPLCYSPPERPYTFLALGDRGARKGWIEVWQAFYRAFGKPEDTPDVRLVIKSRAHTNNLLDRIAGTTNIDQRISFWLGDVEYMSDLYAQIDCAAIPSRSEGWGMPHREAAMMGIPTIATRYSGLKEGIDGWATAIIEELHEEPIPDLYEEHMRGEWVKANVDEVAQAMRWCYDNPDEAKERAMQGAAWLRQRQTWTHAAGDLLDVIEEYG